MALTMREKQAVTEELARRCAQADRRSKAAIITQTIGLTGCNRSCAAWLLRTADDVSRCLPPEDKSLSSRKIATKEPAGGHGRGLR